MWKLSEEMLRCNTAKSCFAIMWKSKTRVTNYEFKSTSYEFKSTNQKTKGTSCKIKSMSWDTKRTSWDIKSASQETKSTSSSKKPTSQTVNVRVKRKNSEFKNAEFHELQKDLFSLLS